MHFRSLGASTNEESDPMKKRAAPADKIAAPAARLLFSRRQTAELLGGISLNKVKQLEDAGVLDKVRLDRRSANGQVFHRASNVLAIVNGDEEDA
jgi:hypothetical protein